MPATTSDLVKEFTDAGCTLDEAAEFAHDYIYEGFKESVEEYLTYRRTYDDDVLNTGFLEEEGESSFEFDIEGVSGAPARILDIGCDYEGGEMMFVEDDRENLYVPSSYYCALKCLSMSFQRNKLLIDKARTVKSNKWNGLTTVKVSPYYMKKQKAELIYKKALLKYMHDIECECRSTCATCKPYNIHKFIPTFYRVCIDNKRVTSISKDKSLSEVDDCILLVFIGNGKYHATLAKTNKPLAYTEYDWRLKVTNVTDLVIEETRIRPENMKDPQDHIFVYDIETYEIKEDSKVKLIPYALGYSLVNLKTKEYTPPVIIETSHVIDNIFNEMFDRFDVICKAKDIKSIQVFAHNGSKFDNIYAKSVTNMLITDSIIDGTNNKSITFKRAKRFEDEGNSKYASDAVKYTFKDTLPFVLSSLAKALITFKCKTQKMDFDIAHYSLEQYQNTTEWKKYLNCDVAGLAELTIALEENIQEFGLSITTCLGASSLAWKLMRKTCIESDALYVPKSPSLRKFMNASCIGGRVLHWQKEFDNASDPMISLDYNSLYPSAMQAYAYPTGNCYAIEDCLNFDPYNPNIKHYIIEAEIDAGNVRYPIHPYRDEAGNLMYKAGVFTGVYNDVDIKEMLRDGYKILSVKRGVYWLMSAKIFSHLITSLYEKRRLYKIDGDVREYTIKIILNSMYGKFLEQIQTYTMYTDSSKEGKHVISQRLLKNGQTEYIIKNDHPIVTKPTYIAGYVLANARKLMNEYIDRIGRENIWYQDTDSIYTTLSCIKSIELGNQLCQLKNDYGDGKYIVKAHFLDLKRYLLIFNDGSVRVKFLGLNFNNDTWAGDFSEITDMPHRKRQLLEKLFLELRSGDDVLVKQEKWFRAGLQVTIDTKMQRCAIHPDKRARWKDDVEYYPYGYDHRQHERVISCTPSRLDEAKSDSHIEEKFYRIVDRKVYSKCPLVYNDKVYLAEATRIPTDTYMLNGRVYRLVHGMLYEHGSYGVISKEPLKCCDISEYTNLSFIPFTDHRAFLPPLISKEINWMHGVIHKRM